MNKVYQQITDTGTLMSLTRRALNIHRLSNSQQSSKSAVEAIEST